MVPPPSPAFPGAQAPWTRLLFEKVPLLALSAASAAVTVFAQHSSNAFESLGEIPIRLRLENAIYSYAKYVAKIFWPVNMALVYPHPLNQLTFFQVGLSAIFLVAMSAWVWRAVNGDPYAITGWLWFLGTLVPVIGLVQVGPQGMADRYAYIPTIGIFVLLVWGFNDWVSSMPGISGGSNRSRLHCPRFSRGSDVSPDRLLAQQRGTLDPYAAGHRRQFHRQRHARQSPSAGATSGGSPVLRSRSSIAPWDPDSHRAVGAALQDRGDLQGAIREYQVVLHARDPKILAYTYANLGVIYRELGNEAAARQSSEQALRSDPVVVRQMIQQLSGMVQARPAAPGYLRLGLFLEGAGKTQDAKSAFERALELDPGFAPARRALQGLLRHNDPIAASLT